MLKNLDDDTKNIGCTLPSRAHPVGKKIIIAGIGQSGGGNGIPVNEQDKAGLLRGYCS